MQTGSDIKLSFVELIKLDIKATGSSMWSKSAFDLVDAQTLANESQSTVFDRITGWQFLPKFKSTDSASPHTQQGFDGCMNAVPQFVTTGYTYTGQAGPQTEASTVAADFERNCKLAGQAGQTSQQIHSEISPKLLVQDQARKIEAYLASQPEGIESTLSEHISKYEDCARQSAVHAAMADHAKKELVRAFESLMNVINEDYKKHMESF